MFDLFKNFSKQKALLWVWLIIWIVIIILSVSINQKSDSTLNPSLIKQDLRIDLDQEKATPLRPSSLSITLENLGQSIGVGDVFSVLADIDTKGSNINLVQFILDYDSNMLEVVEKNFKASVMSMRTRDDSVLGRVDIIRGVPGDGDADDRDDGFTGKGYFGTIVFRALRSGSINLTVSPETKLLLDDGIGTQTDVALNSLIINVK